MEYDFTALQHNMAFTYQRLLISINDSAIIWPAAEISGFESSVFFSFLACSGLKKKVPHPLLEFGDMTYLSTLQLHGANKACDKSSFITSVAIIPRSLMLSYFFRTGSFVLMSVFQSSHMLVSSQEKGSKTKKILTACKDVLETSVLPE